MKLTNKIPIHCCNKLIFILIIFTITPSLMQAAENTKQHIIGEVFRAQFTTNVKSREPVDQIVVLGNDITNIYYFTELKRLAGQKVTFQWIYNDRTVSNVKIDVKSPRWRTYSKMRLDPKMLGKWTVLVKDEMGWPLRASIFEYVKLDKPSPKIQMDRVNPPIESVPVPELIPPGTFNNAT